MTRVVFPSRDAVLDVYRTVNAVRSRAMQVKSAHDSDDHTLCDPATCVAGAIVADEVQRLVFGRSMPRQDQRRDVGTHSL